MQGTQVASAPAPGVRFRAREGALLSLGAVISGVAAPVLGDPLAGIVCVFVVASVLAGSLRPQLLATLILMGGVILPSYVGWLVFGGLFVNLQRGVMYGATLGCGMWILAERRRGRWVIPSGVGYGFTMRLGLLLLVAGWVLAPVFGLALGPGNALKALNGALYEALAFWVGLAFTRARDGRRLIQLTCALLLVYTAPFWLYELATNHSVFAGYVPPMHALLFRQGFFRGGLVRVQATFGHPLAFDQFLLIAIPAAVFVLRGSKLLRLSAVGLGTLGLVALYVTRSRSPWIALAGAALALLLLRRRRLRTTIILVVVLIGVAGAVIIGALRSGVLARKAESLLVTRFSWLTEEQFSAAGRVVLTVASLEAIRARPVVGYGVNSLASSARLPSVDDYYLALALEQGLPVAVLGALGVFLCWVSLTRRVRDDASLWMVFGVGAYLVEWVFVGLHDTAPILFLVLGHLVGWRGNSLLESALPGVSYASGVATPLGGVE